MPDIQVCLSPALFPYADSIGRNVVLTDILRATSSVCTAFYHGVGQIIPVGSVEEARQKKEAGMIVAGEKDGVVLPFADFGNSPFNFMTDAIRGKTVAYCTTNGTKAIGMATGSRNLIIGSYLNISEVIRFLESDGADVLIFCSGWKNRFNIEDTLFAGAVTAQLLQKGFGTECDSAHAAADLWSIARNNLREYIEKCAHRERLRKLGLDDVLDFCHTFDACPCLPVLSNGAIINRLTK